MIQNKSLYKIFLVVLVIASQACTGNFDEINRNPYEATGEEMERDGYNMGASLLGMQSFVIPLKVHLNQFQELLSGCAFAGYMSATPTWAAKFSTYNPSVDWLKAPFNDVISGIYPYYEQIHAVTDDEVALAIAQLLRIASMHRVTDAYGPIPYSQMSAAASSGGKEGDDGSIGDVNSLSAPYDSQEDVYKNMLTDLDEVIATLTNNVSANQAYYAKYDNVYNGVITNWVKFANSLKLRMAIRLSYVTPDLARQTAEAAVGHTIGVIISNAENAFLKVTTNPMAEQISVWNDERVGADIISYMSGYQDPRRAAYFTLTSSTFTLPNTYVGLRGGIDVVDKASLESFSAPIVAVTDPVMWMNAAEVAFLKAEGALRGWNMGGNTPEELYNEGIRLSFEQYGVSGADAYLNNNTSTPVAYTYPLTGYAAYNFSPGSSIKIKWDGTDFEQNLERIITQKWIAIFPLGNEAWAEFRRTGYPKLAPVVTNKSGGTIPAGSFIKRLPYPNTEYTENTENLYNAIGMLDGPDTGGTKLWWDKKP
jgi:hypothetical protein